MRHVNEGTAGGPDDGLHQGEQALALRSVRLLVHDVFGGIVDRLAPQLAMLSRDVRDSLEADALYRTFTDRQRSIAEETRVADRLPIPPDLAEVAIPGLSNELRQKLLARRPATIGEARRISGMTPAGLALIAAHARRAALA